MLRDGTSGGVLSKHKALSSNPSTARRTEGGGTEGERENESEREREREIPTPRNVWI
jgi:hypothetical protein